MLRSLDGAFGAIGWQSCKRPVMQGNVVFCSRSEHSAEDMEAI